MVTITNKDKFVSNGQKIMFKSAFLHSLVMLGNNYDRDNMYSKITILDENLTTIIRKKIEK